jgi:hypothetical protein
MHAGIYSDWYVFMTMLNQSMSMSSDRNEVEEKIHGIKAGFKGYNAFNQAVVAWKYAIEKSIFSSPHWEVLPEEDIMSRPLLKYPLPWLAQSFERIPYPNPPV